ncbi:MAG: efflux RND transporter permease subunit [Alphaproteobacteria bacterium]|nr:efflux RND transporter permease subunit [Alphaproteobacteria bacterium]MCW5741732.1 efflux RND transporter permease subunit [Alphaproteobacteria bacterium]
MRFARFFVDRPIFATVLSVLITLVGAIAYLNLPVAQYPEIAPPTIVVRATYPGADAETVAATVAAPLEEQINGVEGMLYMSSYSSADGAMSLTITFRLGTDLNAAQVLVQNRVSTAMPRLPTPVVQLGVTTNKSSPDFMMVVHLVSPDDSYDQLYVSNYARNRVRDQLLRLDGVGDIIIFGERLYSLRIWLDPDKLAAYGLTPSDVVAAVREQNVQVSGGSLGAQPAPKDNAFQLTVTTQGRFEDPREFRQIIVRSREGRIVRLQDVARVELGAQDYATGSYLNGKPAVAIAVFQRPNTNALAGARNVIDQMERLKRDFPKGIEYRIVYNPTDYIQASVDAVYRTLVEATILVMLVVIVFLQSWRTAIIPILAIPISLIGTCAVMAALGYSLNNLTLFGLVLAIGIVVDDAIVVVENIERNIAGGMSPREAAHRTMDEVGTAVISIALVLSAVFIPTAFIPGITGAFYRQFALTIAVSTVISAFVSLTLSPALAALLLKPHEPHHRIRNPLTRALRWAADRFNGGFDRMARGYAGAVGFVARRKLISLAVYGALIGVTWWVFGRVPTGFIPPQDQGYIIVVIQLPDGASLSRTQVATQKVSDIVRAVPGVANTVEITGLNGATFSSASNSGVVFATLKPFSERQGAALSSGAIIGQVMQRIGGVEEAFIIAVPPPPVRGLGSQGGFKIQLQDRDGADIRRVLASAYAMMGAAQQAPGLMGVFTTFSANTPQVYLEIDRTKAQMLNVPIGAIFEALQNNLGSAYVNDFNAFGRVYQVRVSADERFRVERDRISRLRVRSADGALVPLGTLVEIKDVAGPSLVQRYNMYTSVPLQGSAAPGVATGTALDTMEGLSRSMLPPGIGFEWTELAYQERTTGNTAIFIFALSVVFVFLVLAAQYESWALPLAIVLIVPMSVMSALLGVMARGMDNNVLTQIGLVVLIGLAAKNAILIVEFARQAEENDGLDPVAAVVHACRLRLRPILMTAFAFILGVVPLAFATGAGSEMRQALGTAVMFGMLGVTFFGLFLTPVFYVSLRWLVLKLRPRPTRPPAESLPPA